MSNYTHAICAKEVVPDLPENEMRMLKALADPTRLRILGLLSLGKMHACEIEDCLALDVEQPTVGYHLRILRKAELVTRYGRGKATLYGLHAAAPERWEHIEARMRESLGCQEDSNAIKDKI